MASLEGDISASDQLIFENNDAEDASRYPCGNDWTVRATSAFEELRSIVSHVETVVDLGCMKDLHITTTEEIVNKEIQKFVSKECGIDQLPTLSVIEEQVASRVNSIDLPSMRLKGYCCENEEFLKSCKAGLPSLNAVVKRRPQEPPDVDHSVGIVAVQVYRTISSREVKMLEIEFSLGHHTLYDVFKTIVDEQPEAKMFDGPTYAGSGMIMIGTTMYVTGPEDYSAPYTSWATQYQVPYEVQPLETTCLGSLPELPSLVAKGACGFLFFCGNEMRRIYFSDIALKPPIECPKFTYRRRVRKLVKCCLCLSRTAELVILNDVILPKNPSHCCNSCYRRLRSGPAGEFILPSNGTIVSPYLNV